MSPLLWPSTTQLTLWEVDGYPPTNPWLLPNTRSFWCVETEAFRIADALVGRETRGLATLRQVDRGRRIEFPGMAEVEVRQVASHQCRIGQACVLVLGGEGRDRQRLGDRFLDRPRRQVGGARRALALAGVDGDAKATVTLILERLDLAKANGHREARGHADAGLGSRGAARPRQ
jgi:hypothetical protein